MRVEANDPRWTDIMLQCRAQRNGRRLPRPAGLGAGHYSLHARTNIDGVTMYRLQYRVYEPHQVIQIGFFESWTPMDRPRRPARPLATVGDEIELEKGGRMTIIEHPAGSGLPWPVPVERLA